MSSSRNRTSGDLNGNGIPDKLEKNNGLSDLNGNGIDDKFEKKRGFENMNGNGISDSQERKFANQGPNGSGTTFRTEVLLPTTVIEKTTAVHEEIRREQVEEIQPIINVEKLKTEVHQVTQPLIDQETRPIGVSEKTLATEYLPEVNLPNVGLRAPEDISTVQFKDKATMIVEKPAVYNETQKTQVVEEIQPVIYKETIVPTLIKETKPIFQTVVEGTTYTQTVLPAQQLKGSSFSKNINGNGISDSLEKNSFSSGFNGNGIQDKLEQTTTTTTSTTTNSPYAAI